MGRKFLHPVVLQGGDKTAEFLGKSHALGGSSPRAATWYRIRALMAESNISALRPVTRSSAPIFQYLVFWARLAILSPASSRRPALPCATYLLGLYKIDHVPRNQDSAKHSSTPAQSRWRIQSQPSMIGFLQLPPLPSSSPPSETVPTMSPTHMLPQSPLVP